MGWLHIVDIGTVLVHSWLGRGHLNFLCMRNILNSLNQKQVLEGSTKKKVTCKTKIWINSFVNMKSTIF